MERWRERRRERRRERLREGGDETYSGRARNTKDRKIRQNKEKAEQEIERWRDRERYGERWRDRER